MSGLRHQALLYEGRDEFLDVALPFVRDGVASGDPVIAVVQTPNLEALREALGRDADSVELRDSSDWYVSPGRSFSGFLGFAAANPSAACVRMIGEPVWPLEWSAAVAEFAHYESVFNVIAQDSPIVALCPYDVAALPDEVLEHARATHPEVVVRASAHVSEAFVDPDAYCAHLAGRLSEPVARARGFRVTADLHDLCLAVRDEASVAGVRAGSLDELVLAVHQLAANALVHGNGHSSLRTWCDERSFVCEIESEGGELSETTAGYAPYDPDGERGRGLWLVRQVCDLVEVRSRGGRTTIRVHARRAA